MDCPARPSKLLANDGQITAQDLFPEDSAGTGRDSEVPPLHAFIDDMTRDAKEDYLVSVLRMTGGNMSKAANIAGLHRTYLYHLCRQHGIEPSDFRKGG